MSKDINQFGTKKAQSKTGLNRREILKKYGAYTAPIVVSMLLPQDAYAMFGMAPFSNNMTCRTAHVGQAMASMHCMSMHGT